MEFSNPTSESQFFIDEDFLKTYGLTIGNVLPYFQRSPFYDPTSVNGKIEMKGRGLDALEKIDGDSYRLNFAKIRNGNQYEQYDKEKLKNPECQTILVNPGLVIIDKVQRQTSGDVVTETTLAKYCILNGLIYPAPDIYSILNCSIRSAIFHIRESLRDVRNMFDWDLQHGFRKKVASDETETQYVFKQSAIQNVSKELDKGFELEEELLKYLLTSIGIPKSNP